MPDVFRDGKILLSRSEFEALPDYSCSLPTRTTIGKRWRCRRPYTVGSTSVHRYFMGEYVPHADPNMVGIKWTEISLPDGYNPEVR